VTVDPAVFAAPATTADLTFHAAADAAPSTGTTVTVSAVSEFSAINGSALLAIEVRGAPGAKDTAFGAGGVVSTTPPLATASIIRGLTVAPDGRLVAVGSTASGVPLKTDFALNRYLIDGNADLTFNAGVPRVSALAAEDDEAESVALQTDGQIVVGGYAEVSIFQYKFALLRFRPDGVRDDAFGGVRGDSGYYGGTWPVGSGITIAGSQVVAARTTDDNDGGYRFTVSFYDNEGGAIDRNPFNLGYGSGKAILLVDGGGEIVAVGSGSTVASATVPAVAVRYFLDGGLSTAFSGGTVNVGAVPSLARGIAQQSDGKFVIYGEGQGGYSALTRLLANGTADPSFTISTGTTPGAKGSAVALQPDGKILALETQANGTIMLRRFFTSGQPDTTFGTNGAVNVPFTNGTLNAEGTALVIQANGRAVVAGRSRDHFALARFWL
jgi:uncharacterized delta-60 repeat protein